MTGEEVGREGRRGKRRRMDQYKGASGRDVWCLPASNCLK